MCSSDLRNKDMPDVSGPVPYGIKRYGRIRIVILIIRKQFQNDLCPVPAEDGKVNPAVPYLCAEGIGIPRQAVFQRHYRSIIPDVGTFYHRKIDFSMQKKQPYGGR